MKGPYSPEASSQGIHFKYFLQTNKIFLWRWKTNIRDNVVREISHVQIRRDGDQYSKVFLGSSLSSNTFGGPKIPFT